ncbi:MAG: alpha/beta hydrolase [Planctomycetaceae bacterium]|nr:alpha/beta hydrolase [Planctomycetaceae bacterium]
MTPLLLLPGMDGTGELFRPLLPRLPPWIEPRVVAYPPRVLLDEAGLRDHVRAAAPREGPWFLLGESFSGPVAVDFAATRPPGLRGLLLSATFASCPVSPALRSLRALAAPALFRVPLTAMFVRGFLAGSDCPPEVMDLVLDLAPRLDPAVMAHRLRQVLDRDVTGLLPGIGVPVLYLQASRDLLVDARCRDDLAAGIPGMRTEVLDAPHLLLQVRPREAAAAIADFMAEGA